MEEEIQHNIHSNTVLLVDPRILHEIPSIIIEYHKHLPDWHFVFYCGKNTTTYWQSQLESYVELRELNVINFESDSKYSFFMKQTELWESLYGEFVLTIQADTWIMNTYPFTIDYFMKLDKSYIGGNMSCIWGELLRENITFAYYNCNGGLSLRKRIDMIKILNTFPPKLLDNSTNRSSHLETDPEDVYFTIGCFKLGLKFGDDIESSYFAVHHIFKPEGCFGIHNPCFEIKYSIVDKYPELQNHFIVK